jgi:hypothetical protein
VHGESRSEADSGDAEARSRGSTVRTGRIRVRDGDRQADQVGTGSLGGSAKHASLSTTTRYLNIQRRGLHLAMEKLEESQKATAEQLSFP